MMKISLKNLILLFAIMASNIHIAKGLEDNSREVDSTKAEGIVFSIEAGGFFKTNSSELQIDLCLGAELTYKVKSNYYSLSYLNGREIGSFLEEDEVNFSNMFAITYGRKILSKSRWSLVPSIGISYLDGRRRTDYKMYSWNTRSYQAIGVYCELNAMIVIVKNVNLGLGVFLNMNEEVNYSGIKVILTFGHLE